ncbi:hypothetical protein LOTGIDRAFT_171047 [Lottia gigantea]|uniref:Uncharacterized protein n=1 Tax=Lottia gigantea TaxID=225164 RepID=V4AJ66_LOTGI|nr:hypothetical protein LOTGIDRAFT_171047 [Lottia gigantea]ESP04209.1 hypothetical protein LOTGIDRAFT_171047 [Lottia gigantea]
MDGRNDVQSRSSGTSSKQSGNSSSNFYHPSRDSPTLRGGLAHTKNSNLQRGLSRSMDVIMNPALREKGPVYSNVSADSNNNSKRLENFRQKFSCPEIAAILDQYIPKEDLSDPKPTAMPSPMRRSRSLNELPGSVRVPILKRTETDRMKARLEASIAGTEELKKLRENQEKLMAETRSSVNTRKHQVMYSNIPYSYA